MWRSAAMWAAANADQLAEARTLRGWHDLRRSDSAQLTQDGVLVIADVNNFPAFDAN